MKILIVSLPRTGSSQLLDNIAKQHNLKAIFEPFNGSNANKKLFDIKEHNDVVVKTIVCQAPKKINNDNDDQFINEYLTWVYEFIKDFNKIILLSRHDLTACVESLSFLVFNYKNSGFKSYKPYYYKRPPNEIYYKYEKQIMISDKIINIMSKNLNIPITYYEDIYDLNSSNRLRKINKPII